MTGVSTATLRAWERRYGVPAPGRTESAYRLYSDDDVALIARMRDMVQSGVAPAEAARTLRDSATPADAPVDLDPYQASVERIVEAALQFDVDAVREEAAGVMGLGPALAIVDRALQPALTRVGDLWHSGQITVAQEHIVSNVLLARISQLFELMQPTDATRHVVLACFADEEHVIGLYGAGLHFASWGYRGVFLGARTPPEAVARTVESVGAHAVALSVTAPPSASRGRALVDAYADACREVPWIVGGRASGELRRFVEARGGLVAEDGFADTRRLLERATRNERRAHLPN